VGMSAGATSDDRFRVRLVRPSDGKTLATALTIEGHGSRTPAWKSLSWSIPESLRGKKVAVELSAADTGSDATVEAGVDDVRITVSNP
jgi:hypothetical protein